MSVCRLLARQRADAWLRASNTSSRLWRLAGPSRGVSLPSDCSSSARDQLPHVGPSAWGPCGDFHAKVLVGQPTESLPKSRASPTLPNVIPTPEVSNVRIDQHRNMLIARVRTFASGRGAQNQSLSQAISGHLKG
eukprot:2001803-Pyramimonas_sp.AAC.1